MFFEGNRVCYGELGVEGLLECGCRLLTVRAEEAYPLLASVLDHLIE